MNKKDRKGDFYSNRLFLSLLHHGVEVQNVEIIKPYVLLVMTKNEKKIVKGYSSFKALQKQWHFLQCLKKTGFLYTPYTELFPSGALYMQANGQYWLLMDYIDHSQPFDFSLASNRLDAVLLLERYHVHAFQLPPFLSPYIPKLNWYGKWHNRMQKMLQHKKEAGSYIGESTVEAILNWSFFSLGKLRNANEASVFPYSFIHGDIIEHNFVQTNNALYLIDFDCVSIGPIAYDYVKYCHCVLPFLDWSYDSLYEYKPLVPFLTKTWFLLALLFPSDLLREWSYFLSLPQEKKAEVESDLVNFTNEQFALRSKFAQKLYNIVT